MNLTLTWRGAYPPRSFTQVRQRGKLNSFLLFPEFHEQQQLNLEEL